MDILDKMTDQNERYKIMVEVFLGYIPDKEKLEAMADAAERIHNEVSNEKGN